MEFLVGFATAVLHGTVMLPLTRLRWRVPALLVHMCCALLLHGASVAAMLVAGALREYWWVAASFGFAFMCYLFGFNAVYKSISLQILILAAKAENAGVKREEVHRTVIDRSFLERVKILEDGLLVRRVAELYSATDRGMRLASRVNVVRRSLGVEGGGIYFDGPHRTS